jgi:hypothetical protein
MRGVSRESTMPLTSFMKSEVAAVEAFLDDPTAVLFEIRTVGEHQRLVAKMLAGMSENHEDLFVPVAMENGSSLALSLHQALLEAIDSSKSAFSDPCSQRSRRQDVQLRLGHVVPSVERPLAEL